MSDTVLLSVLKCCLTLPIGAVEMPDPGIGPRMPLQEAVGIPKVLFVRAGLFLARFPTMAGRRAQV